MQSKNTDLHLPKSRCIIDSRVLVGVSATRDIVRDWGVAVRAAVVGVVAVRPRIFCFFAVRETMSRVAFVPRFCSVMFLIADVVRWIIFFWFAVRVWVAVCRFGTDCVRFWVVIVCVRFVFVRVPIFDVSATAQSIIWTVKHAAKIRFRPFISLSFSDTSKYVLCGARIFFILIV